MTTTQNAKHKFDTNLLNASHSNELESAKKDRFIKGSTLNKSYAGQR